MIHKYEESQRAAGQSTTGSAESLTEDDVRHLLHAAVVGAQPLAGVVTRVDHVRRWFDRSMAGDGALATGQIDNLAASAQASARECVSTPPLEMLCRLTLDLADVQAWISRRQPPLVLLELYRVAAQLAALIADELMVLGDVRQSRAWHHTSQVVADHTNDTALRADTRTLAALLPLYYGQPEEAVHLTRQAQQIAANAECLTAALAPTLEALALAQLGADSGKAALATARERVARLAPVHTVESVFGFSQRRWRFYEGKILSYLGRHDEAWAIHEEALALYPAEVVGDPALICFDRSISMIRSGQSETGCALAEHTLLDLPQEHRADIFLRAARRVVSALPYEQRTAPSARRLRASLRSCAVAR